jgi:hypothetical protein
MRDIAPLDPLGVQDADFPHRFAWCSSRPPLEGRTLRWVPYGMPRLNSRFKSMVFFLYGRHPETGNIEGPRGTGFLIGMPGAGGWYMTHTYAVTCHHVALQHGASILRINTTDGKSRFIELEPHEWQFRPQSDDLCAADISDFLRDGDDVSVLPQSLIVQRGFLEQEFVEVGEDGFMLGLFAEHPGEKQNLVAARFGNLSLLAQDDEPIEQPNRQKRPSHIFDMRSRPGFSGSPVFIYRTPAGDLRSASERGQDKSFKRVVSQSSRLPWGGTQVLIEDDFDLHDNTFLMLLGVHAGQYPERIEAQKIRKTTGEIDDIIRDRDKLKIPSSMAVVVPSWEIVNLLNQPYFMELRQKRDQMKMAKRDQKNLPEPEAIAETAESPAPSADDANPNHLADFTRLVDVAARNKSKE